MLLKLETRAEPSRLMGWLAPLFAAALTIVAGFVLFSALGRNPVQAFYTFFVHPIRETTVEEIGVWMSGMWPGAEGSAAAGDGASGATTPEASRAA